MCILDTMETKSTILSIFNRYVKLCHFAKVRKGK